jgi:[ribosomal protein S18]-alanine N-acetyltransferase
VAADNIPALVLYKKLGFQEAGRRKAYYQRPGAPSEDALTLALAL